MLIKRTMDEMITHFNDVVSAMDISRKDKITLLGMITAIGFEYQQAADAIEELQRRLEQALYMPLPRWIPVAERLPDGDNRILVCSKLRDGQYWQSVCRFANNLHEVDEYDFPNERRPGFYYYDGEYGWIEKTGVTHWMPLPEPPKEETK